MEFELCRIGKAITIHWFCMVVMALYIIIREIHFKSTMRYHLKLTGMTIIKKARDNKCWWGYGEKGTLVHYWWEHKLVLSHGKWYGSLSKKLKIEPPYDPAILYIYTKETKRGIEEISIPSIRYVIIDSKQDNENNLSIHQWMNR